MLRGVARKLIQFKVFSNNSKQRLPHPVGLRNMFSHRDDPVLWRYGNAQLKFTLLVSNNTEEIFFSPALQNSYAHNRNHPKLISTQRTPKGDQDYIIFWPLQMARL